MLKTITKREFDALAEQNTIVEERDVEYWYDNVVDSEGNELAFARYRTGEEPIYYLSAD